MSIVKFPISNGGVTLVDADVAEEIKGCCLCKTSNGYIRFRYKGKNVQLHRFVMKTPTDLVVDHINGDKQNNTRENLWNCTHTQNKLNMHKKTKSSSGYRLVYKDRKKYHLRIGLNYKVWSCGMFFSKHIAAAFADQLLVQNVGPFVWRNFSEKLSSS